MNYKKQAEKLERLLEEELKTKVPIVTLKDGSLLYKRFKIHKTSENMYKLSYYKGDLIDTFYLKATAILAAKFYDCKTLDKFNDIKNLDTKYWTNSCDSLLFKERFEKNKDKIKKDIFLARYELTKHRANGFKKLITSTFARNFV